MKTLKVFAILLLLCIPTFSQVAVMGDVSGAAFSKTPEKYSTWELQIRIGITPDLSITGMARSSRSRMESVPKPEYGPNDGGLVGLYYRMNPFVRFGFSGGLQTRRDPNSRETGWLIGGDLFFGMVSQRDYYLKKQVFGCIHTEWGQWDTHPYINGRVLFPLTSFTAVGVKYESDLGYGPHVEFKIPIAADEEMMKSIYVYGSYFFSGDIKTPIVGVRIAVN